MNLLNLLKSNPLARERKHKNSAIGYTLCEKYPELREIRKETLKAIVSDTLSLDRKWRKILEDNEDLRGSDYGDKEMLEQEKQIELGYSAGHYQDVKKLKTIN